MEAHPPKPSAVRSFSLPMKLRCLPVATYRQTAQETAEARSSKPKTGDLAPCESPLNGASEGAGTRRSAHARKDSLLDFSLQSLAARHAELERSAAEEKDRLQAEMEMWKLKYQDIQDKYDEDTRDKERAANHHCARITTIKEETDSIPSPQSSFSSMKANIPKRRNNGDNHCHSPGKRHTQPSNAFIEQVMQDNIELLRTLSLQSDMLNRLQEEVNHLRGQLRETPNFETYAALQSGARRASLVESIVRPISVAMVSDADKPSAVHVHHHYHGPPLKPGLNLLGRSRSQSQARSKKRKFHTEAHTVHGEISTRPSARRTPIETVFPRKLTTSSTPTTPITALRIPAYKKPLGINLNSTTKPSPQPLNQTSPTTTISSNASTPQSIIFDSAEPYLTSDASRPSSRASSVAWQASTICDQSRRVSQTGLGIALEQDLESRSLKQQYPATRSPTLHRTLSLPKRRIAQARENYHNEERSLHDIQTFMTLSPTQQASALTPSRKLSSRPYASELQQSTCVSIPASPLRSPHNKLYVRSRGHEPPAVPSPNAKAMHKTTHGKASPTKNAARAQFQINKPRFASTSNVQPQQEVYAPLTDTFGKSLGGWLSGKLTGGAAVSRWASNAEDDVKKNITGTMSRSRHDRAYEGQASKTKTSVLANESPRKRSLHAAMPNQSQSLQAKIAPRPPPSSAASFSTIVSDSVSLTEQSRRLLHAAGLDPISGLPAMRHVTGLASPKMTGGFDEDALKECLGEI